MNNSLSLCVICKNEEKSIGYLLDSIKGNSLFDEVIIVDTGSTDKTLDILKNYSVTIDHFEWINDFSAARNYAFSKATKDYIMWLDADDYIKPNDYFKLLELKNRLHENSVWLLKYEYAHDEFGNSICSFYRERIVKRSLNLKWEQPIHEYLPIASDYKQVDIEIHHNKKESHTKRNLDILEKIVLEKPNFARNIYYLGKEYFDSGEYEKGCDLFHKFLEMPDAWHENKYGALIRLYEYFRSKNEIEKSKDYLYKSIQIDPLKAKSYYYLGDLALGQKEYANAIHWFNICINLKRNENSLDIVEPKYHTWLPNLQMCLAYNYLGMVKEAAEANERGLKYRPQDPSMLNNKHIFLNSLGKDYPFSEGDNYENYILNKSKSFKPSISIGWYANNDSVFASNRIRMVNINKSLSEEGMRSELFSYDRNIDFYDVIVTGKIFNLNHLEEIKSWRKKGIKVIIDLNEDILDFYLVKETIKECDYIVCCSLGLKNRIIETTGRDKVAIIEDSVEYYSEIFS